MKTIEETIPEIFLDAKRFKAMSECERTTATNKFLVQVIDKSGKFYTAYHKVPEGMAAPAIVYPDKLEALRACLDAVIKGNPDE